MRERWQRISFLVWVVFAAGWLVYALAVQRWVLAAVWITLLIANLGVSMWSRRQNRARAFPPERS